ncbi:hypothetical protein JQN58_02240 [Aneurinibacillus sp. BA2021]|nr:hypothetical protein [Aneurinibacillus sp. BA2021]
MTLRALELQIAIPRMQDIGKIQEHLQQRPQQEQAGLALEQEQKDEVNRTRIARSEEAVKAHIDQEAKGQEGQSQGGTHRQKKPGAAAEEEKENLHPYKGHSLDISL